MVISSSSAVVKDVTLEMRASLVDLFNAGFEVGTEQLVCMLGRVVSCPTSSSVVVYLGDTPVG